MIPLGIKGKFQTKRKNKVGLDIGSYSIKIVEISGALEKPALVGLGLKKIQGSSKEDLRDSIKALADEARISAKDINMSVSGLFTIVRFISMPKMKDEELKSAMKFEAEKFIPFDIKDCIVDFQILKRDEKENRLDILLVATKKDYIEERVQLVESCGYSVSLVDVDSFAIVNSFLRNHPALDPDKSVALLNIGATLTNLSIIRGDMLCLVRDMTIGGNDFNAAISKSLSLDIGSSEKAKHSPGGRAQDIMACTKAVFNNLVDEIRLSYSYYENQYGGNVDEFYISGGGASLIGLEEFFQEALGSKLQYWNPLEFLDVGGASIDRGLLDKMSGSFVVAVGLALR